jgi:phenolic acid decarboxylase
MFRKQNSQDDHVEDLVIASSVVSGKWQRAKRHINDKLLDLADGLNRVSWQPREASCVQC